MHNHHSSLLVLYGWKISVDDDYDDAPVLQFFVIVIVQKNSRVATFIPKDDDLDQGGTIIMGEVDQLQQSFNYGRRIFDETSTEPTTVS